jgi:hypothetical protein
LRRMVHRKTNWNTPTRATVWGEITVLPLRGGTPRVFRAILSPYSLCCLWSTIAQEPFDRSKWTTLVDFGVP